MNKRIVFLMLTAIVLLISNCKQSNPMKTYIYQSKKISKGSLSLFIDDKYIGKLPYIDSVQKGDLPLSKVIVYNLTSGRHDISAKDTLGNFISSMIIDYSEVNISHSNSNITIEKSNNKLTTTAVNVGEVNSNNLSFKSIVENGILIVSLE